MDTLRNPLMGSLPCGQVFGARLRISLLAICLGVAAIFGIGSDDESVASRSGVASVSSSSLSQLMTSSSEEERNAEPGQPRLVSDKTDAAKSVTEAESVSQTATNEGDTDSAGESAEIGRAIPNETGSVAAPLRNTPTSEGPAFTRASPTATSTELSTGSSNGIVVGLFVAIALLGSSLLHEMAEVVIGQRAGVKIRAVVLMPAGGMTIAKEADTSTTMAMAFVGPVVHLGLCLICLPAVIAAGNTDAISLFSLPTVSFNEHWFASAGLLLFSINLKLVVLNMLPIPPFDGARFVRAWRAAATETETESSVTAFLWNRWGIIGGLLLLSIGLTTNSAWTVAIGGLAIAWCCGELLETASLHREAGGFTENFGETGYALGGSEFADEEEEEIPRERTLGPIARWRAKKDAQKRQREREERAWAEEELDRLLDKVSKVGMDGLTADEKKTLQQVSSRFKQ